VQVLEAVHVDPSPSGFKMDLLSPRAADEGIEDDDGDRQSSSSDSTVDDDVMSKMYIIQVRIRVPVVV
jgi:hypothetical protein